MVMVHASTIHQGAPHENDSCYDLSTRDPSIKALVAQLPQPLCMAQASLKTTGTSESWNFQPAGVDLGGFPWFTYQNEAFMDPHAGSIMFYLGRTRALRSL